jgi:hypothetical protein
LPGMTRPQPICLRVRHHLTLIGAQEVSYESSQTHDKKWTVRKLFLCRGARGRSVYYPLA